MFTIRLLAQAIALLSIAVPATPAATACTPAEQIQILDGVPPGFNLVAPGASAAYINSLPLTPSCTLTLYVNGLPGIAVAPNAETVKAFALLVRQAFDHVASSNPPTVDNGNGTATSELQITTGLLHSIPLPVTFEAGLVFNYVDDASPCMIESVVGILTIPTEIDGVPITDAELMSGLQKLIAESAS